MTHIFNLVDEAAEVGAEEKNKEREHVVLGLLETEAKRTVMQTRSENLYPEAVGHRKAIVRYFMR